MQFGGWTGFGRAKVAGLGLRPKVVPPVEGNVPTAVLVFRDGRRSEIQNYAIVGQTLWVFTERRANKIPRSDLDLEATKNANEERDVEFQIP